MRYNYDFCDELRAGIKTLRDELHLACDAVNVRHSGSSESFEQRLQDCQTDYELSTTRRLQHEQEIR
ncbi:MAG: hypothetical protein FWB76_04150 [Oscillospiraceae bacterium]|nr:hypothetical protein [Oscillospiraceae bacterium]